MAQASCVPVLMYHHVSPNAGMITTSPENFKRQISGLAKAGFNSLTADQFAGFLQGEPVPEKSILLTFDDGYLDNYVYAHPVLEQYGMHALLFIITGLIGFGPPRAFQGQAVNLPFTPTHKEAKALMFSHDKDQVMLRWSEIEIMRNSGTFEFHSHTHTHERWDLLPGGDEIKNNKMADDLAMSRLTLKRHLGDVSDHLCWPQGYFDTDYIELANKAGFKHLYTTDAYGQNKSGSHCAHIYRFAVRNRGFYWIAQRIWLAAHPFWGPLYNRWKLWKRSRRNKV
jgi:peptidoglycan/xylan/chitin deacetylase (PgdA/CDA1 family)